MIGNKLEQSIISVFQENLSSTYSINQISKILKKSYPLVNKKSNFFLQEGILKKIDIGRSYQCFLNMHNDKTKVLMAMNEINKKELFARKNHYFDTVMTEVSQLAKKFHIDTVLLYKKTLIFVTSDTDKKDEIMEMSILTRDYTLAFFNKKGFQERFVEDVDLQKYHLILYNTDICLNLITGVADKMLIGGVFGDKLQMANQNKYGEDTKDSKDVKYSKDSKDSKEAIDTKDNKNAKNIKGSKDIKNSKESEDDKTGIGNSANKSSANKHEN